MTFGVSASFLSQLNEQTSVPLVRPPWEEGAASPPWWSLSVSLSCHGKPHSLDPAFPSLLPWPGVRPPLSAQQSPC